MGRRLVRVDPYDEPAIQLECAPTHGAHAVEAAAHSVGDNRIHGGVLVTGVLGHLGEGVAARLDRGAAFDQLLQPCSPV